MIRQTKNEFIKKLCENIKVNQKHFRSYIRSKTAIKDTVVRFKNRNGNVIRHDLETTNEINRVFQGGLIQEDTRDMPEFVTGYNGTEIENVQVYENTVKDMLKDINGNKSGGPDDIRTMQRDIKRLEKWSKMWLLDFSVDKCITFHVGHRNPNFEYEMNVQKLNKHEVVK
ncbi:hypothetical protein SK128_022318 [Halocaridina rubra]|uniref:Uncharacterized protein n=1 Tax=Halocaridina rubra TaxID=373956 RepID=A0AAN8WY20_HALRR